MGKIKNNPTRAVSALPKEAARLDLFRLGFQYYLAGRFLILAQTVPVPGNVMHHAVEMCLKGALAQAYTLDELTNRYRHNLKRLWRDFKQQSPDDHSAFDAVVAGLHRFERLRYPDALILEGAEMHFALFRGGIVRPASGPKGIASVPRYELTLEEIDDLVFLILRIAQINPSFFFGGMNSTASEVLRRHNKHVAD